MLVEKNLLSISIVIPTYNCGNFLNFCLDSIVNQEYSKDLIEILIIDGGSTDNTVETAQKYTVACSTKRYEKLNESFLTPQFIWRKWYPPET